MICSKCKAPLQLSKRQRHIFPIDALSFCSEKCLRRHVYRQQPLSTTELKKNFNIAESDSKWGGATVFSPCLNAYFRSMYERMVAEHIVLVWRTPLFYEPHILPIDSTHSYLPDFWIPEFGVWLEVKGEWRLGAKSKFMTAQRILGKERLLLLPDAYRGWFKCRSR